MNSEKLILIVDDEELNTELLIDLLTDYGYITVVAHNGKQALEKYAEQKPDLILLDVMMPILDGYATSLQLREQERDESSHTPILFLSAKATLDDKLKGYAAGGDDYITKPFDNAELLVKVETTLLKKQQILALHNQAKESQALTYQMMTNAAKVGAIGRFLQNSLACSQIQQLLRCFFDLLDYFELACTLKIYWQNSVLLYSQDGIERPLDNEIILGYKGNEKIFHFGKNRALFNWGNVTLLVRNVGDEADNIAIMMDGLLASHRALSTQELLLNAINDFRTHNHLLTSQSAKQIDDLNEDLRVLFSEFGSSSALSEHDEEAIASLVDRHRQHLDGILSEILALETCLSNAVNSFTAR